jgi:hypothetical protein
VLVSFFTILNRKRKPLCPASPQKDKTHRHRQVAKDSHTQTPYKPHLEAFIKPRIRKINSV